MDGKRIGFGTSKAQPTRTVWGVTEHAVTQAKARCEALANRDELELRRQIDAAMRAAWESNVQLIDPQAVGPTWLVEWRPDGVDSVLYIVCVTNTRTGPYFGLPCAVTVLSEAQGQVAVERARWHACLRTEAEKHGAEQDQRRTAQPFPACDATLRVITYPRDAKPPANLVVAENELEQNLAKLLEAGVRIADVLVWSPARVKTHVNFQLGSTPLSS